MKMASRELGGGSLRAALALVLSLAAFGGCGGGDSAADPAAPGTGASPGALRAHGSLLAKPASTGQGRTKRLGASRATWLRLPLPHGARAERSPETET